MNRALVKPSVSLPVYAILFLCVASSAAYPLVAPPTRGWVFGLAVLAPLFVAVSWARRWTAALLIGLGWGFLAVLLGCTWLVDAARRFAERPAGFGVVMLLAYAAAESGRFGLACVLFKAGKLGKGWDPLVFALALVASELGWPQIFPWPIGTPLVSSHELAQSVAWAGAPALTFMMGLASGSLGSGLDELLPRDFRQRPKHAWVSFRVPMGYLAAIAGLWAAGAARIAGSDWSHAGKLRVAVVQAGLEAETKRERPDMILSEHVALTRSLSDSASIDLAIWSETVALEPLSGADWERALQRRMRGTLDLPVLLGANIAVREGSETGARLTNSALIVGGRSRPCRSCRYDKQLLVPFTERSVFDGGSRLGPLTPTTYVAGPHRRTLDLGGRKLGVFICFESLSAHHVRDLVRQQGAEVLVNLSNDGWFARGAEPELHLALASLRAIEQARFLVRVASNGISAVIDASGRSVQRIELHERRVQRAEIALLGASTPYSILGDAPWFVACAALVGARLFARMRLIRRRTAGT